ncbi:MAG: Holliday junction resolvase Hjc [Saccharolobus sp.]|uniref:Holliday-junction resolvase n=3 Tax=Saccharolobus TaxID=2100760 RepID=A0A8F5BQG4_SACSH|nr:Holliday junction resolvase Hjc [Saccharolobus shibatae]MCH4816436.1 endonuclease [Saccharolobus shibatae]QXJ29441.1 Holliday-junction resolvase [Saccharolobus shibatae B12]QXJ35810.1 Holliday-junction resolvase [Saccharolobus shibatae]
MNRDIGKNAERELVSILRGEGFNAVRIPTSNSSPNPLPDIFATKGNNLLSIECKSTWESKVKVKEHQVKKLFDFLSMFTMNGIPVIAVKFKQIHEWRVLVPEKAEDIVVTIDNTIPMENLFKILEKKVEEKILTP